MAVSLRDIAKRVGKDTSTVSLALRGGWRIPPETRKHICDVAREMGYRPNILAKGLIGVRTNSIGLVVHSLNNFHVAPSIQGVQQAAGKIKNMVLLQTSMEDRHQEEQAVRCLTDRAVDGLIVEPTIYGKELFLQLQKERVPFVFIILPCGGVDADAVLCDDALGSEMAVRHLHELGHRKIGLIDIAYETTYQNYERISRREGYARTIKSLGLSPCIYSCEAYGIDYGYKQASAMIDANPDITAIYASSETLAVGVSRAIKQRGLRIPQDISLVGFEGGLRGESMDPPLTTLRGPMEEIGATAADMLFQKIADGPCETPPACRTVLFKPVLIVRNSTCHAKN